MNGTKEKAFFAVADETLGQVVGGAYSGAVFMYTMQPGDSLTRLAHRFGTTVALLKQINALTDDPKQLHPGARLMIPQR